MVTLVVVLSRGSLSLLTILSSHLLVSWLEVSLELLNENLDEVHHVRSVKEVKVKVSWLLLGVVLPVDSVSHLFLLELSLLLHLVKVDVELLSIENLVVQLVLGKGC